MKRFEQFDSKNDFWKTFPELLTYSIFKELKDTVKTSSETMWALHICEHPKSMVFSDPNKHNKFKQQLASIKNFPKFVEEYRTRVLSPAEMQLIRWKENLDKINDYANTCDLKEMKTSEVKHITDIMEKIQKLFQNYDLIQQSLRDEDNKINERESLSETGEI